MLGFWIPNEYCITDTSLSNRLESCYDIPYLSFVEGLLGCVLGTKTSNFECLNLSSCIDEFELVSFFYLS